MANFVGAITEFNPYIQQIPTEAYTKVGMFKEQMYEAGVAKVQDSIDKIAGLDIANEGGKQYLRARVDELTKSLNKYAMVDFSNPNNVSQLVSLARPLYQDKNIVNDVINTSVYRRWDKISKEKMEKGDMDPIQYYYEQQEVSKWLNSPVAGSQYTGRSTPNDSTYEKITKKVLDFKSKLKPDTRYTEGSTFLYGSKSYNVSELSELFYNQILDGNDREMLAHNSMFNDSLRYNIDPNTPKVDLINIYSRKKADNEIQLRKINLQIDSFKDKNDPDYQSLIRDRDVLQSNIQIYSRAISDFSKTDPTNESQKMGIYTNISAEHYKDSLRSIFEFEELEPKYRDDVKQSRDHHNSMVNAAIGKGTVAYTQLQDKNGQPMWDDRGNPIMGIRAVLDENNNPTILEKQSDLITTVDANGNVIQTPRSKSSKSAKVNPLASLLQGTPGELANYNVAGEQDVVHLSKAILSDQYASLDGIIQQNVLSMAKVMERASTQGFNLSDYYTIEQIPGPDGKDTAAMVWKSPEKKKEFMSYIDMMNSAWHIEKSDGNQANKSFMRFINGELSVTSEELGLQGVDESVLADLMTLKGKNAILSAMDEVFKDKSMINNLANISTAIQQKKNIVEPWRKILSVNAQNAQDRSIIDNMTDDDIMKLERPGYGTVESMFGVNSKVAEVIADRGIPIIKYTPNGDGTYTATAYAYLGSKDNVGFLPTITLSRSVPKETVDRYRTKDKEDKDRTAKAFLNQSLAPNEEISFAPMGYSFKQMAENPNIYQKLTGVQSNPFGVSSETIERADNELKNTYSVIRQNVTRSMSLLNIPENKQDKDALIQTVTNSLIGQGGEKILTDPTFIQLHQSDVASIVSVEDITGASNKAVGNFFNNSGFINLKIRYQDSDGKEKSGTASFNVDRILQADPNFASKFSKYFAGLKYAQEGAAIRVKSSIDPTSGYKSYSGDSTGRNVSPLGNIYSDQQGYIGTDFSDHVVQTSDNHTVPISYKVVSYGNTETIGNKLNNTNIDANRYAIQLQVNTPSGKQNIFLRSLDGNLVQFSTPEEALYQLKDVLFKNLPLDHAADYIKDNRGNKVPNYFAELNSQKPSLRGLINTQLRLNGVNLPDLEKIKSAYADLVAGKATELDKNLLKFSPIY